jgi:hypothetical protein
VIEKREATQLVIVLSVLFSLATAWVAFEVVGLHDYIRHFSAKGNIPPWYYWVFQIGVAVCLLVIATHLRGRARPVVLSLNGLLIGYCLSFVIFHAALIFELGGPLSTAHRWAPLGVASSIALALLSPLILLSPVFGLLPFGIYAAVSSFFLRKKYSAAS